MKEIEVNGEILAFPDEMSDDDIKGVLRKKFPAPQQEPASKNPLLGGAGAFASGVNRMSTAGILGIPGDTALNLAELTKAGLGYGYSKLTGKPVPSALETADRSTIPLSSAWFEKQISKVPGGETVLTSDAAEYPGMHAAGQAAGGAVFARNPRAAINPGDLKRAAVIGGITGLTGQKTAEATGSDEAGILANLLTPIGLSQAGNVSRLRPSALRIFDPAHKQAEIALRPYTPQQIKEGIERQRNAAALGNPIESSQALGGGGRLMELENYFYDSPDAPKAALQRAQERPQRAAALANRIVGSMGRADLSLDRANRIESAAEAGLAMPKTVARQQAQPYYDALRRERPQLPEDVRWKLAGDLDALNKQIGLLEESYAGRAVSDVAKTATKDSVILQPTKGKVPFRRAEGDIYELDNYLKEISGRIQKLDGLGADAKQSVERAGLTPALTTIKKALVDNSPTLKQAKNTYSEVRTALEGTVRATGIADIARRSDADAIVKPAAKWSVLEQLLKRQQAPEDLKRANQILSRSDPDAVAQLTRNVLHDATAKHFDGVENDVSAPMKFAREVKKTPNILTAIEITAARNGAKDPASVAKGFSVALDVLEASGLPSGRPGGGNVGQQSSNMSAEKSGATFAFGNQLARNSVVLRNIRNVLNKYEIQQLNGAISSPDSLAKLQELAGLKSTSERARQLVREIMQPAGDIQQMTLGGLLPVNLEQPRSLLPTE